MWGRAKAIQAVEQKRHQGVVDEEVTLVLSPAGDHRFGLLRHGPEAR